MTPIAGQTIGTFILRQKVAEGGMGSVWAAEHVTLHRDVAVKFLTRSPSADDDTVRRFELEARTMARISSPHVPQIFDQGVCPDGTLYIVMELVAGVDLRTWVAQRGGHLDLAQVVRLVDHICLAMSAAHELGIIHRDIKPENIILSGGDDDFHATLVDFGIAKSIGLHLNAPGLTLAGSTMGTPSYMSPEQLTNVSAVDERSDVWSLAVAAYWALTGCLPFEGETFAAVCLAISRGHFVPASEMCRGLPVEVDTWFDRALNPIVELRSQSAELLSGMLKVAAAKPAEWTHPMAAVPAPASRDVAPMSELPIGGVSHTARPSVVLRTRRRRDRVLFTMGAAAIAVLAFAGVTRIAKLHVGAFSSLLASAAPVALAVPAAPISQLAAAYPPAPLPEAAFAPEPIPSASVPLALSVPTLPSPPKAAEAPTKASKVAREIDPISTIQVHVVQAATSANASPGTVPPAPADSSSWHASDELGEP